LIFGISETQKVSDYIFELVCDETDYSIPVSDFEGLYGLVNKKQVLTLSLFFYDKRWGKYVCLSNAIQKYLEVLHGMNRWKY